MAMSNPEPEPWADFSAGGGSPSKAVVNPDQEMFSGHCYRHDYGHISVAGSISGHSHGQPGQKAVDPGRCTSPPAAGLSLAAPAPSLATARPRPTYLTTYLNNSTFKPLHILLSSSTSHFPAASHSLFIFAPISISMR